MNKDTIITDEDRLCQLSDCFAHDSPEIVLQKIATLYRADAVGIHQVGASQPSMAFSSHPPLPARFPWSGTVELPARLQTESKADVVANDLGEWLVGLVVSHGGGPAYWVWAQRSKPRGWAEADASSWWFASHALRSRLVPAHDPNEGTAEIQRRLEHTAAVTARLSHDFGNYLTGMMGFTELALLQMPTDGIPYRYLQEVLESARNGANWIRRLHLFFGRSSPPCWPTQLSTALEAEEIRQRTVAGQGLRWELDVPANLPLVALDLSAAQTIIAELVTNAREATGGQGRVALSAQVAELDEARCANLLGAATPGAFVELTVSDDGPGIPAEQREKLFRDVFFSTRPKHRGLGLMVVYGMLQRCGGGMSLGAPASGQGFEAHVYLPVAEIAPGPQAKTDSTQILLAQTDPHTLETMRRILEANRYRVTIATSSQAAFSAFTAAKIPFALVIADVQSADIAGLELGRRILQYDENARLLFLMSHSSMHGLGEDELLKRFPLYQWPMDPRAFLQAVNNALPRDAAGA